MRKFLFLVFIVVVFFSCCERKSGRNMSKNKQQATHVQNTSTQSIENRIVKTQSNSPNTTKKVMSGAEIFDKYNSAVFMVFTSDGLNFFQGSGFFISKSGLAVSNYHVFKGTGIGYERIKLVNNKVYTIESVLTRNEEDDYIIFQLETDGDSFNFIPLAQRNPKVGENVYAIGSPRGLENTFSSGEISQLRGDHVIQINVPIDHGSSGGALINRYGEAIGITTAGIDDSQANLNFAINIGVIKKYLID